MVEIEDGSACVKNYFEPKHATPSCEQGLVMDELTGPKCKTECAPGYHSVSDYCYANCPSGLKQCGALCIEDDFICTKE